jgi:hypothetical protein
MANLKNNLLPILAIVAGGAAALFGIGGAAKAPAAGEAKAEAPQPAVAAPGARPTKLDGDASPSVEGEVLERIDVGKYTYLRVGARGTDGVWAAVPTTTTAVGARVRIANAERMTDFASATLKRTFPVIYFGVLGEGAGSAPPGPAAGAVPNPHAGMDMAANAAQTPHSQASGADVPVGKVERAAGATGHTVSELYDKRGELVGKSVKVRGVVVKSIEGVLGHTFVHVRDGSGDTKAGTNDVTLTTSGTPKVGQTVLFEGKLATDKDFGSGYRYPVIVEDATLLEN